MILLIYEIYNNTFWFDYTKQREQWLGKPSISKIVADIKHIQRPRKLSTTDQDSTANTDLALGNVK